MSKSYPYIIPDNKKNELDGLSVVIPVYKENPDTVIEIYYQLHMLGADILVVDDGNTVNLPEIFNKLTYEPNMGYGYALKRGIERAKNPIVLTMDGDGQHTVEDVVKMYKVFKLIDNCDMLVGCRWNLKENFKRWAGRKILNFIASIISGHYLIDLNSGMRIFKKELALGYSPILCDTFSFTTSFTISLVTDGHKIAWFPINVLPREYGKSNVKVIKHGFITLYYILWIGIALRTRKIRGFFRK